MRRAELAGGVAVLAGAAVGVATNLLQGVLPGSFNSLANAGSVWVVAAFVAGALIVVPRRLAAVAGACTQVGAVVGYYGYAGLGRGGVGDLSAPTVWLVLGLVAGPIFGLAGSWWRRGSMRERVIGAGVLGAVFCMDGLWHLVVLDYYESGWGFLAFGAVIPIALGRSWPERGLGVLTAGILALPAFGFYYLIARVTGLA
jgi:Family of unknown function (DUF6518)